MEAGIDEEWASLISKSSRRTEFWDCDWTGLGFVPEKNGGLIKGKIWRVDWESCMQQCGVCLCSRCAALPIAEQVENVFRKVE